jgi:hypothetical protein
MSDSSADFAARARADRSRHEQAALAAAFRGLLGQAADGTTFLDLERADSLVAEFLASHRALTSTAGAWSSVPGPKRRSRAPSTPSTASGSRALR